MWSMVLQCRLAAGQHRHLLKAGPAAVVVAEMSCRTACVSAYCNNAHTCCRAEQVVNIMPCTH